MFSTQNPYIHTKPWQMNRSSGVIEAHFLLKKDLQ